jgi:hypothetical protein
LKGEGKRIIKIRAFEAYFIYVQPGKKKKKNLPYIMGNITSGFQGVHLIIDP